MKREIGVEKLLGGRILVATEKPVAVQGSKKDLKQDFDSNHCPDDMLQTHNMQPGDGEEWRGWRNRS